MEEIFSDEELKQMVEVGLRTFCSGIFDKKAPENVEEILSVFKGFGLKEETLDCLRMLDFLTIEQLKSQKFPDSGISVQPDYQPYLSQLKKHKFVFCCGLPGSGKSYSSKEIYDNAIRNGEKAEFLVADTETSNGINAITSEILNEEDNFLGFDVRKITGDKNYKKEKPFTSIMLASNYEDTYRLIELSRLSVIFAKFSEKEPETIVVDCGGSTQLQPFFISLIPFLDAEVRVSGFDENQEFEFDKNVARILWDYLNNPLKRGGYVKTINKYANDKITPEIKDKLKALLSGKEPNSEENCREIIEIVNLLCPILIEAIKKTIKEKSLWRLQAMAYIVNVALKTKEANVQKTASSVEALLPENEIEM